MTEILRRYPILLLLVPYLSGLYLGPGVLLLWSAGAALRLRAFSERFPRQAAWASVMILMAGVGALLRPAPLAIRAQDRLVQVTGRVTDGPWPAALGGGSIFTLEIRGRNPAPSPPRQRAYVITRGAPMEGLEPGTLVSFPARSVVDASGRCLLRTHTALIQIVSLAPSRSPARLVYRCRRNLGATLRRSLSRTVAGFYSSILLGIPGSADRELKELFQETGTRHLLAISGLHVGFVLLALASLLSLVLEPGWCKGAFLAIVLVMLCFLTGARTPVIRAVLTGMLFVISSSAGRAVSPVAILLAAGTTILILEPRGLEEISFQLSFAGYGSILLFLEWESALTKRLGRWPRRLVRTAGVSCAAWCGTAPLTVFHFGHTVVAAPCINLLVMPLFGMLLCLGYLHLMLCLILHPAARRISPLVETATQLFFRYLDILADIFAGPSPLPQPSACSVSLFYMALFAALILPRPSRSRISR